MRELETLLKELVEAPSQVKRRKVIGKISRSFYRVYFKHGMEPSEIITLTGEIIGLINEEYNYLKEKKKDQSS